MYENVLVPTDGSEGSVRAAEEAIDLAKQYGATLHTIYVVDTAALPGSFDGASIIETLETMGKKATNRIVERARSEGVETANPEIRRGVVHREILDYAEGADVDLVVMATHGRSGLDRFLLGSVTEKVVRSAEVPVLTVNTRPSRGDGDDEPDDVENLAADE